MNIEELYLDEMFDDFLVYTATKNLLDFDDYKQDVFLEIIESGAHTTESYKRAAWRVRNRQKKKEMSEKTVSLDSFGDVFSDEENGSVLWEDNNVVGG